MTSASELAAEWASARRVAKGQMALATTSVDVATSTQVVSNPTATVPAYARAVRRHNPQVKTDYRHNRITVETRGVIVTESREANDDVAELDFGRKVDTRDFGFGEGDEVGNESSVDTCYASASEISESLLNSEQRVKLNGMHAEIAERALISSGATYLGVRLLDAEFSYCDNKLVGDEDRSDDDCASEPEVGSRILDALHEKYKLSQNRHGSHRHHDAHSQSFGLKDLVRLPVIQDPVPAEEIALNQAMRPKTRGDCVDGPRPCPWVACRHHLYLDVDGSKNKIRMRINFPDLEPDQLEQSCSLDMADEGESSLEVVGAMLNLTRERVRQLESKALTRGMRSKEMRLEAADMGLIGSGQIVKIGLPIRDEKTKFASPGRSLSKLLNRRSKSHVAAQ